jgi:DnaJ-class molecular chaperone
VVSGTVQKAYETLSDERKRRAYDSEMDFDEGIPTGRERGDFFKVGTVGW